MTDKTITLSKSKHFVGLTEKGEGKEPGEESPPPLLIELVPFKWFSLALDDLRQFCSTCRYHKKSRKDKNSPCYDCWDRKNHPNWVWKIDTNKGKYDD